MTSINANGTSMVEVDNLPSGRAVLKQYSSGLWAVYWRPVDGVCTPWNMGVVHEGYDEAEARQQYHRLRMWALNQEA